MATMPGSSEIPAEPVFWDADPMSDAANTQDQQVLPLFYKAPQAVSLQRHADLKVKQKRHYGYADKAHAIPVVLDEVPTLAGHYPLVFTPGPNTALVGLLGIRPDENLLVKADGSWEPGHPIPAYVTRYPFILVQIPDEKRLILVMEEDERVVAKDGDLPLFTDGKGTQHGQDVLNYCQAFNQAVERTQAFTQELTNRGMLVEQRADITLYDGRKVAVSGFCVIDEKKFNELPDEVFVEWRKRNWIGMVYAHFLSLGRWGTLIELNRTRDLAKAANGA